MKYDEKVKLTQKLFLPLLIFLILIGSISIASFFFFEKQRLESATYTSANKVFTEFDREFQYDMEMYEEMIKLISKDKNAVTLFQNRDKKGLYEYYHPLFEHWKLEHNITHFYFHRINKVNFLRVHNYKKSDDVIDRITLNKAIKKQSLGAGIEFGIHHNLTLRVVYPWFVHNQIIGYIELGKEIDYFTPELAQLNGVDVIFTLNKDLISKDEYEDWLKKSKSNTTFQELDSVYILDSTLDSFDRELMKALNRRDVIKNLNITNFSDTYNITTREFIDASGNSIGKTVVLQNITNEYDLLTALIIKITLAIALFLSLLLAYYFNLIKKQELKIETKQNQIITLSIKDSLTNLFNRRYFDLYFDEIIENKNLYGNYLSFISLDVDNFKKYNDNYGHMKGDEALIAVANSINDSLNRFNDKSFRLGGEEFGVLLVSKDKEIGKVFAEKIRANVEGLNIEHLYNEAFEKLTVSVGVNTVIINETVSRKGLLESADHLLYQSKRQGRNRVTSQCI